MKGSNVHYSQKIKEVITLFNALQVGKDTIFVKMTVIIPQGVNSRLHMVVTSEIKKGLNLANYAKADTNNGDVHLAGKSSPRISIPFILENVKDISEFIKRIPIEKNLDNNYFSKTNANYSSPLTNDPNARKSKDDTIYDGAEIEDLFDDYEDSGNDEPVDVKKLLRRMSPEDAIFRLSDRIGRRAAYDRSTPYKLFPLSTSSAHSAGPTAPFCSKPSER